MKQRTVAVTGGGSGGHITPLISLLNYVHTSSEFVGKCNNIYRFGERNSLEQKACAAMPWVNFVAIPAGKIRRYRNWKACLENIKDLAKTCSGIGCARWELRKHKVDIVFGKGGYVSFPVCFAAWLLGIKVVIHESDLFPGLANRLLYPFASKIFTGFEQQEGRYRGKYQYVGQILALQLWDKPPETFVPPTDTDQTVVLVLGGSQGARVLFEKVSRLLDTQGRLSDKTQFIITLGTKNTQYKEVFSKYTNVYAYEYLDLSEMGELYRRADIAITRGGVTSLAEQKVFGIKSCIVPTPFTGGNHQLRNARRYEKHYGDTCIEQNEDTAKALIMFLEQHLHYKKTHVTYSQDSIKATYTTIIKEILVN